MTCAYEDRHSSDISEVPSLVPWYEFNQNLNSTRSLTSFLYSFTLGIQEPFECIYKLLMRVSGSSAQAHVPANVTNLIPEQQCYPAGGGHLHLSISQIP